MTTGIVLTLFTLCLIAISSTQLTLVVIFITFGMLIKEMSALSGNRITLENLFIYGIYLPVPLICFFSLKLSNPFGLLWIISIVVATDIGAYIFGKIFGKYKIASKISPNKTWEGLTGGVLLAIITGIYLYNLLDLTFFEQNPLYIAAFCAFIACFAQMGDFFESHLKRQAGAKDSGSLLPGHGGLLDRLDGHLFALPVFWLLLQF